MQITDDRKIRDVQTEFNKKFPYLKLEFYRGRHESGKPSHAEKQWEPDFTIGKVRTVHSEGDMSIDGHLKVSSLEDRFWKNYGLNVQVFRLSGNLWLQTSTTDQWTLSEQNRKGERSEKSFKKMHTD